MSDNVDHPSHYCDGRKYEPSDDDGQSQSVMWTTTPSTIDESDHITIVADSNGTRVLED